MHLVKWFRKNMSKLMAIFVILIMIAFIMPTLLSQLARPNMNRGIGRAVWSYSGGKKITVGDIQKATSEIAVLRALNGDKFLFSQQDLRYLLLGELLFPEVVPPAALSDEIKRMVAQNRLRVSGSDIDKFFSTSGGQSELLWLLLKAEAAEAGCAGSREQAAEIIRLLAEKIGGGQIDPSMLVQNVARNYSLSDESILGIFADLMSILSYSRLSTDIEDVTEAQLAFEAAKTGEQISVEFVEFSAEQFLDKAQEPSESQLVEHFEKYKSYFAGIINENNPYGFGYKIPARAAIEYMAVKLEDIKAIVAQVSEQEAEDYYHNNIEKFAQEIPTDPNDPNSPKEKKYMPYAELASYIKEMLMSGRVSAKASSIIQQAVNIADGKFTELDFEKASVDDFKAAAVSYAEAAKIVSEREKVNIYTAKTGLISAEDFQTSPSLASLTVKGQSRSPVPLSKMVFSVEQFGDDAEKLGSFEPAKPKMFVSIFPAAGREIMAAVRVIETAKPQIASGINYGWSKNLPKLIEVPAADADAFKIRDAVVEDLRKLSAYEIASARAKEFAAMAKESGWDKAMAKLNSDYPPAEPNTAVKFSLQNWQDRSRISKGDIETMRINAAGISGAEKFISQSSGYAALIDRLYGLFDSAGQDSKDGLAEIIKYDSRMGCMVVKKASRKFAKQSDYIGSRQQIAYGIDYLTAQAMAFTHFMPDNIKSRLSLQQLMESSAGEPNDADGGQN